jgi:hypothetical protein
MDRALAGGVVDGAGGVDRRRAPASRRGCSAARPRRRHLLRLSGSAGGAECRGHPRCRRRRHLLRGPPLPLLTAMACATRRRERERGRRRIAIPHSDPAPRRPVDCLPPARAYVRLPHPRQRPTAGPRLYARRLLQGRDTLGHLPLRLQRLGAQRERNHEASGLSRIRDQSPLGCHLRDRPPPIRYDCDQRHRSCWILCWRHLGKQPARLGHRPHIVPLKISGRIGTRGPIARTLNKGSF